MRDSKQSVATFLVHWALIVAPMGLSMEQESKKGFGVPYRNLDIPIEKIEFLNFGSPAAAVELDCNAIYSQASIII